MSIPSPRMLETMLGGGAAPDHLDFQERGRPLSLAPPTASSRSASPSRPPTSAEIDAVIAAAIANAPPAPPPIEPVIEPMNRSHTPLMTNLLPAAVGSDGRVNLFVGNLPYRVRWQDLKDLFRKAGTVLRADVSLGPDNRSRGFGTVLMGSREDAARAIDRFNGYTWQTRTLEVRPDRLPPEYEAQTHHMHVPHGRGGVYPFNAGGFQGGPGGAGGQAWPPSQRPPISGPGAQSMMGMMSLPGMGGPYAPPMTSNGSSPIPLSQTPAPPYGVPGQSVPAHSQHTGATQFTPFGASPLAGSLSAGTEEDGGLKWDPSSMPNQHLSHEAHLQQPNRVPSPHHHHAETSQPTSSHDIRTNPPSGEILPQRPPPLPLGQLGSSSTHTAPGAQSQRSPSDSSFGPSRVGSSDHFPVPPGQLGHGSGPMQMEGLAHRGAVLGPPSTLHDRVVFVSNLPLTMQWQELKDLLRPAGIIIRADVASDTEGRPRGFGTALFGNVADAARAVSLFNDREIAGHRIRVNLERDTQHDVARRQSSSALSSAGVSDDQSRSRDEVRPIESASVADPDKTLSGEPTVNTKVDSPMRSKVPWQLNLSSQSTPNRNGPLNVGDSTPHFRNVPHPGHIAMPPFHPLDNGNPLSPLQTRGLPPMTPSMPGFVFNAYPETPPVHNHFFPHGMGPFSPGIPVTSPIGFSYNPFLNAAPGGPVNRFPQGGSAQLGTPTTQSFPNNPIRGAGPPGRPGRLSSIDEPSITPPDYFAPISDGKHDKRIDVNANPSALNARDRLASTGPGQTQDDAGELSRLTESISLNGLNARRVSPPSPTRGDRPRKTFSRVDLPEFGAVTTRENGNGNDNGINGLFGDMTETGQSSPTSGVMAARAVGRVSLDDKRPNLGSLDPGGGGVGNERRASFGDAAK